MSYDGSKVTEGYIPFTVEGETYQTFYKLYGTLENRTRNPLIVLHGGPGLCHNYLTTFGDLAVKYDVPVILYDQLGNAKSTHLKEKPPTFWNIDLFIDELENLLKHFSIQDGFDLAGHSWGGILASEFEVRRQPEGLKHLIITNSLAASALWNKSNGELMATFPDDVKQGLMGGMKNPEGFFNALKAFHAVHGCTIRPVPEEYWQTLEEVFGPNGDPTVAAAPILQNWSIIDRLHLIRVPTFVINGRKDISQDFVVQPFFEKIQKVKWVTFENSSHSPFIEEKDKYMQLASAFLAV
ncbi:proline-specific peptidase [Panaeolus papilionaceus]|nr:proline-specific peptidase [Panaeolus papilionaceus]